MNGHFRANGGCKKTTTLATYSCVVPEHKASSSWRPQLSQASNDCLALLLLEVVFRCWGLLHRGLAHTTCAGGTLDHGNWFMDHLTTGLIET